MVFSFALDEHELYLEKKKKFPIKLECRSEAGAGPGTQLSGDEAAPTAPAEDELSHAGGRLSSPPGSGSPQQRRPHVPPTGQGPPSAAESLQEGRAGAGRGWEACAAERRALASRAPGGSVTPSRLQAGVSPATRELLVPASALLVCSASCSLKPA